MTLQISFFGHPRAGDCAGTDKEYRQKVRSLSYNLRDATNPELRARVLQGEVPPDRLVQMTPAEMASKVSAHHLQQLSRGKKKEKFALFSNHNGGLQRRQPGARCQEQQQPNKLCVDLLLD